MFKKVFGLESVEGTFEGFTAGHTFNGFELPLFEMDEAMRILMTVSCDPLPPFDWRYDAQDDCFIVGHPEPEYFDPETVEACDITDEDGKPHHVYGIGYGYWIWTPAEDLAHE